MQILEDHNKQLESQLQRLRELLLQVKLETERTRAGLDTVGKVGELVGEVQQRGENKELTGCDCQVIS
jgi:hypothetical protein